MSRRPRRVDAGQHPERRGRDRGVSDVVAFVFTFSIIILSVGVVSAVGFSVLEDVQSDEQALNAQRAFQSLGENLNQIDRGHVPGRSGEISLSEGAVFVRTESDSDNSTLGVSVDPDSDGVFERNYDTTVGTLLYESQADGTRIALESGAVVRKDELADQGVVVRRPNFVCSSSGSGYAVVSLVKFVSDENLEGGEGTVQIVGREQSSTLLFSGKKAAVEVDFSDSRFSDAWRDYFRNNGDWAVGSPGSITATCGTSSGVYVIVRRTVVELEFVG